MMAGAMGACAGAGAPSSLTPYVLLYPQSVIEVDMGGRCARLDNLSGGLVYVPLAETPSQVAKAFPGLLDVKDCGRR